MVLFTPEFYHDERKVPSQAEPYVAGSSHLIASEQYLTELDCLLPSTFLGALKTYSRYKIYSSFALEPILVCFLLYIIDSPVTNSGISSYILGLDEKLGKSDALRCISTKVNFLGDRQKTL